MICDILPVIIWMLVPFADAWNDARKWKANKKIIHWWNAVKRCLFLAAVIAAFPHMRDNKYALTAFICFGLFSFWATFNLVFNKLTGRDPSYLSNSVLDRVEQYVPFKQALFTKIGFALFSLAGYFVSLNQS